MAVRPGGGAQHYASFRLLPKPKHECSCTSMRFQF